MSRIELLPEGLVILPSGIAPGPAGVGSGHQNSGASTMVGEEISRPSQKTQSKMAPGLRPETVDALKSGVGPSRETSGPTPPVTGLGELVDGEPFHIEPPASNAWVSSRSAVRSDTGEVAWRLTPRAISHLFGSPNPPYRRVDEILGLQAPGSVEREQGGTSKP